jgi:hypothetical protein
MKDNYYERLGWIVFWFFIIIYLALIIVTFTWTASYGLVMIDKVYGTPYTPYTIVYSVPNWIRFEVIEVKYPWVKVRVSWFNQKIDGWVYLGGEE